MSYPSKTDYAWISGHRHATKLSVNNIHLGR